MASAAARSEAALEALHRWLDTVKAQVHSRSFIPVTKVVFESTSRVTFFAQGDKLVGDPEKEIETGRRLLRDAEAEAAGAAAGAEEAGGTGQRERAARLADRLRLLRVSSTLDTTNDIEIKNSNCQRTYSNFV